MTCRSGTVTGGGWQFLALFRGKDYGEIVEAGRGEVVDTSQPWVKQGPHGQFSASGLHTSAEHDKGRHGCTAVAMDVMWLPWMYGGLQERRRQDQVSPNNRHCLCLFPMCRACSHLLVHFCELLQSQLTGGINKKESWTSTTHA